MPLAQLPPDLLRRRLSSPRGQALIGIGAAVLWTGQGTLMSQCTTDENKTQYFSIFWGIFNLCVIPGNVASHFILQSGTSHHGNQTGNQTTTTTPAPDPLKTMVTGWESPNSILFIVLTIAGAVGVLLFSLIVAPDSRYGTKPT